MTRLVTLSFLLALASAEPAGAQSETRPGGVGVTVRTGDGEVSVGVRLGGPRRHGLPDRDRWRDRRRPIIVYPVRRRDDEPEPVAAKPVQSAPPPPEPEAAPEPLDPKGSHRRLIARGTGLDGRVWEVGEPLPDWLPHVTLDPRAFGLPEPPPGQIYARVRGNVLLIEAEGRVVVAEVGAADR